MKAVKILLVAACTTASFGAAAAEAPAVPGMTPTMTKAMNPATMTQMMGGMMNPMAMMSNPLGSCASCHSGEEVARYQKTMGPMIAMMNPRNWINPGAYMNMMAPMMDPKTYREWYNAYQKKMGSMAGGPAR